MLSGGGLADEFETLRVDLQVLARAGISASLRGKLDPEDLVQQTLLKAYQSRDTWRGTSPAQVRAWLRSILTHLLIDQVRKFGGASGCRTEHSIEQARAGPAVHPAGTLPDRGSSPSHRASRHERNLLLAQALNRLPADQRRAVELRHLQGRSLDEVAAQMAKSEPAIAGLVRRGLLALRADLGPLE